MSLVAEKIFDQMTPYLETRGEEFVKKLNAIYQFHIFKKKGDKPVIFTVDLKNGKGSMTKGDVRTTPS